ncbi:hypothetical protein T265_11295 [Opisthorchis viverrini]|uniref:Uncharacterized protein n=1 Tax=Opisthorchis viverrini TaxID=6198 RepID=A0A074ZY09_OPIVI|nr:hypothetical protein T265_11295 [Opisthorchis viverrini]KER20074.1 hypothetical protein T265_11295 [Opisthorchis viverrini]
MARIAPKEPTAASDSNYQPIRNQYQSSLGSSLGPDLSWEAIGYVDSRKRIARNSHEQPDHTIPDWAEGLVTNTRNLINLPKSVELTLHSLDLTRSVLLRSPTTNASEACLVSDGVSVLVTRYFDPRKHPAPPTTMARSCATHAETPSTEATVVLRVSLRTAQTASWTAYDLAERCETN